MSDLGQRIADAGSALTPTERRLAELVLDEPTAVAFGTVADLAQRAGTSGPTVVRFATKLEFDGFVGLQNHVRQRLTEQLRRPTDRIRRSAAVTSPDTLAGPKSSMLATLQETLDNTEDDVIDDMATAIAGSSGRILVLCAETSAAPGRLLADNLRLLRPDVTRPNGSRASLSAQIADISANDVVIAIDFPRYETAIVAATEFCADNGATVVAITDGPLSPLTGLADTWAGLAIQAVGPFDSVLPAVAVTELLVAKVAVLLRAEATNRLDRIETQWTASRVFVPESPSDRTQETP